MALMKLLIKILQTRMKHRLWRPWVIRFWATCSGLQTNLRLMSKKQRTNLRSLERSLKRKSRRLPRLTRATPSFTSLWAATTVSKAYSHMIFCTFCFCLVSYLSPSNLLCACPGWCSKCHQRRANSRRLVGCPRAKSAV